MALLSPPTIAPGYRGDLHHFATEGTTHHAIPSVYSPQAWWSEQSQDHFPPNPTEP